MLLQKVSQTDTHILFVGAEAPGCLPVITRWESAGVTGELWSSELVAGEPTSASPVVMEGLLGGFVWTHTGPSYTTCLRSCYACRHRPRRKTSAVGGSQAGFRKHPYLTSTWGGLPWWPSG